MKSIRTIVANWLGKEVKQTIAHEELKEVDQLSKEEIKKLLHDLRVHQIELELQNEELKRTQEELVRQQESYFHLFHMAPIGYALIDKNGIIRKANQLLSDIFDLSRCDFLDEPLLRYIHEDDQKEYATRFHAFFNKPEGKILDLRVVGKNDEIIDMEIKGRKEQFHLLGLMDDDRSCPLILITFNDITKRKIAEEIILEAKRAAEEANSTKSKFIADMSHELRTPLNSVIGFSEALLEGYKGDLNSSQKHYVNRIHQSGKQLLKQINEILDISKIESGKMELHLEDFRLKGVFAEIKSALAPMTSAKNIDISFTIEPLDLVLTADNDKLKHILLNLISNALKFTPVSGQVLIKAISFADRVEISVRDTGIGISEEDQQLIFEPFKQISSSQSSEHVGTGLGLSLVKKLVEMHKGRIWVESETGKGSVFTFTLPRDIRNI